MPRHCLVCRDNHFIRKLSNGVVTFVAGTGQPGALHGELGLLMQLHIAERTSDAESTFPPIVTQRRMVQPVKEPFRQY